METVEVHLELLIGRQVRALNGRPVGRVHEVLATAARDSWLVTEFHIGNAALLESVWFGFAGRGPRGFRVPWDRLDLSDPMNPRLTCPLHDLEPL